MRFPAYLFSFTALLFVVLYCYYLKVAQIDIHSCFRPLPVAILGKNSDVDRFQLVCDGWPDGRTDGRTDTPSYRDATAHLKRIESTIAFLRHTLPALSKDATCLFIEQLVLRSSYFCAS